MEITMKQESFCGNYLLWVIRKEGEDFNEIICRTGSESEALMYFEKAKKNNGIFPENEKPPLNTGLYISGEMKPAKKRKVKKNEPERVYREIPRMPGILETHSRLFHSTEEEFHKELEYVLKEEVSKLQDALADAVLRLREHRFGALRG